MRIFVTGATGFVGAAVVRELLRAGHSVLGLVRSDDKAKKLAAAGAEVHRGDLDDVNSLRSGAAAADGVIHTAFRHDFADYENSATLDTRAIAALADALEGSNRPLVVTSGTLLLVRNGALATESDDTSPQFPRKSEEAAWKAQSRGIAASVVRLPPSVHDKGDHGFVPMLMDLARKKGASAYVGDGENRWPAVHRLDAARLFRLAVEKAEPGARYHAVGDEGVRFRDIAECIGKHLGLPVISVPKEKAADHFDWFAKFVGVDCPASYEQTRASLGWIPREKSLLADMDENYFTDQKES